MLHAIDVYFYPCIGKDLLRVRCGSLKLFSLCLYDGVTTYVALIDTGVSFTSHI